MWHARRYHFNAGLLGFDKAQAALEMMLPADRSLTEVVDRGKIFYCSKDGNVFTIKTHYEASSSDDSNCYIEVRSGKIITNKNMLNESKTIVSERLRKRSERRATGAAA